MVKSHTYTVAGRMMDAGKKVIRGQTVASVFSRDKKWNVSGISVPAEKVDRILNALRDLARFRRNPKAGDKYSKVVNDAISEFEKLRDENRAKYHPNRVWVPYTIFALLVGVAVTIFTLVARDKIKSDLHDQAVGLGGIAAFLAFVTILIGNGLISLPAYNIAGYEGLIEFLKECLEAAKKNADNLGISMNSKKR